MCPKGQFKCKNGHCIYNEWICDSYDDCGDYSDEYNCSPRIGCPEDRFDCGNSQCFDFKFVCDKDPDCSNNADEAEGECNYFNTFTSSSSSSSSFSFNCTSGQFKCNNSQCINQSLVCNNEFDCTDQSDEAGCVHCSPVNEFPCKSLLTNKTTQCIRKEYICDGVPDCPNGEDEKLDICSSSSSVHLTESSSSSYANNVGNLLSHRTAIEMKKSQSDQSSSRCFPNQFHCSNGQCISLNLHCNGRYDCSDLSDEQNCDQFNLYSHRPTHYTVNSKTVTTTIDLKVYDTPQTQYVGDDVVFRCRDEGQTRNPVKWSRLDGKPFPTGTHEFNGRLTLYSISLRDSGIYRCTAVGSNPIISGEGQLTVIPRTVRTWSTPNHNTNNNNNNIIINDNNNINTYYTSKPEAAELRSPKTTEVCLKNEFECKSGGCIERNSFCNEYPDCKDGSDEKLCVKSCYHNEFRCSHLYQCISKKYLCDGVTQCSDGSDELFCSNNSK